MNARYVLVAATTTWLAITTFVGTTLADHRPGNVVVRAARWRSHLFRKKVRNHPALKTRKETWQTIKDLGHHRR